MTESDEPTEASMNQNSEPSQESDSDAPSPETQPTPPKKASDRKANRRQFFALLAGMGIDQMEKKNEKAKSLLDRFLYPDEEKNSRNDAPSINPVDAGEPDDDAWYRDRMALEKARQELWDEDEEEDDQEAGLIEEQEEADLPLLAGPVGSVSRGSFSEDESEDPSDPADYVPPEDDDAEEDPVRE